MSKTKQCIDCRTEIPIDANICKTCGRHQSRWRNEVTYFGSILGVITVLVSAFLFVVGKTRELSGANIEIIKFNSLDNIVAINNGAAPGVITNVWYSAEFEILGTDVLEPLYVEIKPGEVVKIALPKDDRELRDGAEFEGYFACEKHEGLKDDIRLTVFLKNDAEFKQAKSYFTDYIEPTCTLSVGVFSSRREERKKLYIVNT
ncbi:MAG: hypothetical protein AAGJ87_17715 [Pseudomonadota bacterium]